MANDSACIMVAALEGYQSTAGYTALEWIFGHCGVLGNSGCALKWAGHGLSKDNRISVTLPVLCETQTFECRDRLAIK